MHSACARERNVQAASAPQPNPRSFTTTFTYRTLARGELVSCRKTPGTTSGLVYTLYLSNICATGQGVRGPPRPHHGPWMGACSLSLSGSDLGDYADLMPTPSPRATRSSTHLVIDGVREGPTGGGALFTAFTFLLKNTLGKVARALGTHDSTIYALRGTTRASP